MNAHITMVVNCVEAIVYLLLYYLRDCTFKDKMFGAMEGIGVNRKLTKIVTINSFITICKSYWLWWCTLWSTNAVLVNMGTIKGISWMKLQNKFPASIYLLKVNNTSTRTRCKICSKLTIKTPEQIRHHSDVFIVNFEHISHFVLLFLLLTLNRYLPAG